MDRRRGNGFKLKECEITLVPRKKFFTAKMARYQNRLPGEVVNVLFLEVFSARLDGALSNLI